MSRALTAGAAAKGWQPRPFRWAFQRLTSVRFALWLIGLIALAALLGVVFPQEPGFVRGDAGAKADWLVQQRGRYGAFTDLLDAAGIFNVFHSWWFTGLMLLLIVSVAVCTCARFAPTWRQITRPQLRVADRYFETAHFRGSARGEPDAARLRRVLRKHGYRVVTVEDGPGARLYADRYRWSHLGTFVSHLSLVIFLVGGFVTWRLSAQEQILIAEGTSRPVFAPGSADHMQVKVVDFVRRQDAHGNDVDLYSDLAIYKDGKLVASGKSSINNPLSYGGLRFHQSAFAEDGAELQVRDAATGRVEYDEVVQLAGRLPAPRVIVQDASGQALYNGLVPLTFFLPGRAAGAALPLAGRTPLALALRQDGANGEFRLAVSAQGQPVTETAQGGRLAAGGLQIAFVGLDVMDTAVVQGLPGTAAGEGTLVEMGHEADGSAFAVLVAQDGTMTRVAQGASATISGQAYTFGGQRALSGITVRRDPGEDFIWVATGLLLGGLLLTFYVPRRRLWAKVEDGEVKLAGVADRWTHFDRELGKLAEKAARPRAGTAPAAARELAARE